MSLGAKRENSSAHSLEVKYRIHEFKNYQMYMDLVPVWINILLGTFDF